MIGQVFNFAGRSLNTYDAVADDNRRFRLVGYYGVVKRGNEEFLELYYAGSGDSPEAISYRGGLDWKGHSWAGTDAGRRRGIGRAAVPGAAGHADHRHSESAGSRLARS